MIQIIFSLLLIFQSPPIPEFHMVDGVYILPYNHYSLYKPLKDYLPSDDADVEISNVQFDMYMDDINNYYYNKPFKRNHNVILKNITYNFIYSNNAMNYTIKEIYNNLKQK